MFSRKVLFIFTIASITVISLFISCKKKAPKEKFVPYESFIKNDVALLDSTPLPVFAYTLDSSKKIIDSAIIDKEKFKEIAKQFYVPSVSDKKHFKHFTEKSYNDDFTNSWTFNYTTRKKDLPIKEVIVSTTLSENNSTFSSLIVKKENAEKKYQQLVWEAKKNCTITTFDDNMNVIDQKKYVWGM